MALPDKEALCLCGDPAKSHFLKRQAAGLTQAEAAERAKMADVKTWGALERPKGRAAALGLLQIHTAAEAIGTTGADLIRTAVELRDAAK